MTTYNMTMEQESRIRGVKALACEINSIAGGLSNTESTPWSDARCKQLDSLLQAAQILASNAQFHYENRKGKA